MSNNKIIKLGYEKSMTLDEIAETWIQMDEYITNVNEMLDRCGVDSIEELEEKYNKLKGDK